MAFGGLEFGFLASGLGVQGFRVWDLSSTLEFSTLRVRGIGSTPYKGVGGDQVGYTMGIRYRDSRGDMSISQNRVPSDTLGL